MKKKQNFLESLEKYGWVVISRSPLPWAWTGIGLVVLVLVASITSVKTSVVGLAGEREIAEKAARWGDYTLARKLYLGSKSDQVLGVESELEDLIYPEQKLQREIEKWEKLNLEYPSNREVMTGLATLYEQAGRSTEAGELRSEAWRLDPNDR